ncbi:uncharacterized protein PODANS_6_3365 [Podospora anserina S mat+]|uniref:Podospora anserina S mat+ genomic DNA chromosome 6, supercontig 2 n=1 Tax=Podospora anserina (strain S / ATCC MYA-4624 / DSM 980 / FGSC 10383) TaxID=515849 RepID=B2B2F3_PODAN|nr:uncharacterized protein PODANS_6_3365 [Podospora anserina S mat+]CAP71288.1 unnamed protein product [Podospora anserina S mat+]CDP30689.1 Putative protein of unknown function [Podospora anserina S mat+]
MENDYPGWNETFMAQDPISSPAGDKAGIPIKHDCNVPGDGNAKRTQIGIGVMYLSRLSGTAGNGPGPENCGRVSCSWNSAIIWCNNNNFYKELQWTQIAGAAQYVVDQCSKRKSITPLKDSGRICAEKTFVEGDMTVKGHANFDDGWYVVVRGDWC